MALFREVDDKEYMAYSLFSLALGARSQGEYARTCALFEKSVAIHRELGNKRGIAHSGFDPKKWSLQSWRLAYL